MSHMKPDTGNATVCCFENTTCSICTIIILGLSET